MTVKVVMKDGTVKEYKKYWAINDGGSYIAIHKYLGGRTEAIAYSLISEVFVYLVDEYE